MEQKRQAARISGVMDPVIEMIAKFSDKKDLEDRIQSLFRVGALIKLWPFSSSSDVCVVLADAGHHRRRHARF